MHGSIEHALSVPPPLIHDAHRCDFCEIYRSIRDATSVGTPSYFVMEQVLLVPEEAQRYTGDGSTKPPQMISLRRAIAQIRLVCCGDGATAVLEVRDNLSTAMHKYYSGKIMCGRVCVVLFSLPRVR
jgi:hypothetical protein